MNGHLKILFDILTDQATLYDRVLSLVEEEHSALAQGKPDGVLDIVRRKETVLLEIRTLEESRRLVCARLAGEWGVGAHRVTLRSVEDRAEASEARHWSALRERLAACASRLQEANQRNLRLCNNGLDTIHRVVEEMSREVKQQTPGGYGQPNGKPHAAGRAGLLDCSL